MYSPLRESYHEDGFLSAQIEDHFSYRDMVFGSKLVSNGHPVRFPFVLIVWAQPLLNLNTPVSDEADPYIWRKRRVAIIMLESDHLPLARKWIT